MKITSVHTERTDPRTQRKLVPSPKECPEKSSLIESLLLSNVRCYTTGNLT